MRVFRGVFPAASLKPKRGPIPIRPQRALIEAVAAKTNVVFRGVFPAASLKRPVRGYGLGAASLPPSSTAVFRGVFPAASLKRRPALYSVDVLQEARSFPRGIPRGLIEAGGGPARPCGTTLVMPITKMI